MTVPGVSDELTFIREVQRGFAAQRLEDQYSQFKDDPLISHKKQCLYNFNELLHQRESDKTSR